MVKFKEDSERYEIWGDLINDIYNSFDDPDLVIEKIDKLLGLTEAQARSSVEAEVDVMLAEERINEIAKELESDFGKKFSWLFEQITNTYGRDSIKMITRYFVKQLSKRTD